MSTATTTTAATTTAAAAPVVFSKYNYIAKTQVYLDAEDSEEYAACAYAQSYTEGRKGACNYCTCQYYCKQ